MHTHRDGMCMLISSQTFGKNLRDLRKDHVLISAYCLPFMSQGKWTLNKNHRSEFTDYCV